MQPQQQQPQNTAITRNISPLERVKAYAKMPEIQERFQAILGGRDGRAYVESVIVAVANSEALQECSPKSIIISAMRAASLRLSVDPIMKQAHLVPFGKVAQLIVDYHGLVMMMERTGHYRTINVSEVWEGETVKIDRFTGQVDISGERKNDNIVGWCAFFETNSGMRRWLYMTNEQCDAHGQKYSKAFNSQRSGWQTDREAMRRKTVLRLLAQRWGHFSPSDAVVLSQEDEVIDAQTSELPDDNNIEVPEKPRQNESEILSQLGFSQ